MKLLKSYLLIIICILFSFSSICNASISRTEIDTSTKKHHPNQKRFLQIDFGGHIIAVDTDDFVYLHNGPSSQNYVLTNDEYEIVICDYLFYTSEDINTKDINTKPLKELRNYRFNFKTKEIFVARQFIEENQKNYCRPTKFPDDYRQVGINGWEEVDNMEIKNALKVWDYFFKNHDFYKGPKPILGMS